MTGFIPEEKINEIRDRTHIVSLISQYVPLKKTGVNYTARCPFHAEKTASFVVSEAKKIYHCFGCGKGGNIFTFLMEQNGLSFLEAVKKLANDLGIDLPKTDYSLGQKDKKEKKEFFYKINKTALLFFREQLKNSKKAQDFLVKRGLNARWASQYHVGFSPRDGGALERALKQKGFSTEMLAEVGLVHNGHDRFRNRIIFPLLDLSSRVLGFGGRGIDDEIPKYLNSPETLIYHKGRELYGLMQAVVGRAGEVERSGFIIVEGYFDCLLLVQAGFRNVVATMGTALTSNHIDLLKRFSDTFYLCFDGDLAGLGAAERSLALFLQKGSWPRMIELPSGYDPDDFIRKYAKEAFLEKIKGSPLLFDVVTRRITTGLGNEPSAKTRAIEKMIPILSQISIGVERDEAVRKVADQLHIQEKWLLKPLSAYRGERESNLADWKREMQFEMMGPEIDLLEILILFPHWLKRPELQKVLDLFMDLEVKMAGSELKIQYEQLGKVDIASLLEKMNSESLKQTLLRGILSKENQNLTEKQWEKFFGDYMKKLEQNRLEQMERQLLSEIRICETKGDVEEKKVALLSQYQKIVKQKKLC